MPKNLVILCDGTWNKETEDDTLTNIGKLWWTYVHLAGGESAIKEGTIRYRVPGRGSVGGIVPGAAAAAAGAGAGAASGDGGGGAGVASSPSMPVFVEDLVYYDRGVGTGGLGSWILDKLDQLVGGVTGEGLDENIQQAYRFLAENYERGDRIFLFGFSRGAYTVRSLAGMIRNVGLIESGKVTGKLVRQAYGIYRSSEPGDHPNSTKSRQFRRNYSVLSQAERDDSSDYASVGIYFMGVYDTVGARGMLERGPISRWINRGLHGFHDGQLGKHIKIARHALAIDEHRGDFKPSVWTAGEHTDSQQRWFAGAHSDVGGGYGLKDRAEGEVVPSRVLNYDDGLADITRTWMLEEATKAGLSLPNLPGDILDRYHSLRLLPDFRGKLHDSRTGVYLVAPVITRKIGKTSIADEVIDPSVGARMRAMQDGPTRYAPTNVIPGLSRIHIARAITSGQMPGLFGSADVSAALIGGDGGAGAASAAGAGAGAGSGRSDPAVSRVAVREAGITGRRRTADEREADGGASADASRNVRRAPSGP